MKIKKATLHIQIADALREMIMIGELKNGDKINENDLCTTMGISKTPLREALRVLSAENLIALVPNRGAYVTKPTTAEIKEMFAVMSVLEGVCARAATEKMTPADFACLEKLHAELEEKFDCRNQEEYIRVNNRYHSFIQDLAGNRTLNQIVSGLRKKILLYRFQSLNLPGRFEASIKEHRDLLEAFRNRAAPKAEKIMKTHLQKQSQAIEALAKKIGEEKSASESILP
ncbi:MAG: GntR family transcriptional regulator [Desulfobacterales bacterium]